MLSVSCLDGSRLQDDAIHNLSSGPACQSRLKIPAPRMRPALMAFKRDVAVSTDWEFFF